MHCKSSGHRTKFKFEKEKKKTIEIEMWSTTTLLLIKNLVILYQALILSVINYGFGLLTLSAAQLKRLESIQNETMGTILCCTKDTTSSEAIGYLLGFPTMAERHKLAQVKAFLRVMADKTYPPLHRKVDQRRDLLLGSREDQSGWQKP